jgi:hypothetical protein
LAEKKKMKIPEVHKKKNEIKKKVKKIIHRVLSDTASIKMSTATYVQPERQKIFRQRAWRGRIKRCLPQWVQGRVSTQEWMHQHREIETPLLGSHGMRNQIHHDIWRKEYSMIENEQGKENEGNLIGKRKEAPWDWSFKATVLKG